MQWSFSTSLELKTTEFTTTSLTCDLTDSTDNAFVSELSEKFRKKGSLALIKIKLLAKNFGKTKIQDLLNNIKLILFCNIITLHCFKTSLVPNLIG